MPTAVTKPSALQSALPELVDEARSRSAEFEESCAIADDFANKLKDAGVTRIFIETERGGVGGTIRDFIDMVATLAEADGSTGWVAGHWAMTGAMMQALASDNFLADYLADPRSSMGWSNIPKVEVNRVDCGYQLTGRWAFASGCKAATFIGGDVPLNDPDSPEGYRSVSMFAPASEGWIDETWDVVGLAGSGSHTIVLKNVFIPDERTFNWPDTTPLPGRKLGFLARPWLIGVTAGAVHLGLARRAIDEARAELSSKRDKMTGQPLVASSEALTALEAAEGLLFAIRGGLDLVAGMVWEEGLREGVPSDATRLIIRNAATTAVHEGTRIVRDVFDIAGASSIRNSGALQRVYRDASCLIHHVSARRECFERAGRVRVGLDPMSFEI